MTTQNVYSNGPSAILKILSYSTDDIGQWPVMNGETFGRSRLATDSIGTFYLTLTNVVVGSVIRVEISASGAEVETRTADATSETFNVPAYSVGSSSNDLKIKVRKGSAAPKYIPFETLATASVGSASVYVSQVADAIA